MMIRAAVLTALALSCPFAANAGAKVSPEQAAGLVPMDDPPAPIVPVASSLPAEPSRPTTRVYRRPLVKDDRSAIERYCDSQEVKRRDARRERYYRSFNHYRHLNHPVCPPNCSPTFGYYPTCWRRFPEEFLWCPECPRDLPPAAVTAPAVPVLAPPPVPAATPAPAPMPEPPN